MVAGMTTPLRNGRSLPDCSINFDTSDVDATAAKLQVGPMDIAGVDRFAIAMDPQHVSFLLMTGASPDPSAAFIPGFHPGHAVWNELATPDPDPDRALAFYGALFGWAREGAMSMGPMGEYVFLGSGEPRPSTVMSNETIGAPARWN